MFWFVSKSTLMGGPFKFPPSLLIALLLLLLLGCLLLLLFLHLSHNLLDLWQGHHPHLLPFAHDANLQVLPPTLHNLQKWEKEEGEEEEEEQEDEQEEEKEKEEED